MKAICTALALLALASACPAAALTFAWSFTPTSGSISGPYAPVTGTLTGLHEGNNDGWGVTATVTSNPFALLNGGYTFGLSHNTNAFVVTSGVLTFARGGFFRDDDSGAELYFERHRNGLIQNWLTEEVVSSGVNDRTDVINGDMTFALTSVPEPATWSLLIAGFASTGLTVRRRRRPQHRARRSI